MLIGVIRMKKIFLIICFVSLIVSCAYLFDGISDISVSLNSPDEIVVVNNARVSTLRSMDGKIVRAGKSVYKFHFDVDIPAGYKETITVNDFVIQNGDKIVVIDAEFSWDM